jgi:hypothetical protein
LAFFKRKKAAKAAEDGPGEGEAVASDTPSDPAAPKAPGVKTPAVTDAAAAKPADSPAKAEEQHGAGGAPKEAAPKAAPKAAPAEEAPKAAPKEEPPKAAPAKAAQPAEAQPAPPQPPAAQPPAAPKPAAQPPAAQPPAAQPPADALARGAVSETLPVALEPELRRIIDTAVARVASIELEAIRESRQLTLRTEEEGREALRMALDRAFQLVNSFELMTVTVAGMVSALRVELDSAMAALQQVDDPYARLTPEQRRTAGQALPAGAAPTGSADAAAESQPTQTMNGEGPELQTEPSPEIAEMFREQIINMKTSGKTREEAERTLLRFNLGRRFIGVLDEVYSEDAVETAPPEEPRGRFARRFFTRR